MKKTETKETQNLEERQIFIGNQKGLKPTTSDTPMPETKPAKKEEAAPLKETKSD